MLKICSRAVIAAIAASVLITVFPAAAGPQPDEGQEAVVENVKLTIRLGKLVDGKRSEVKSYDLVVISGGISSRLLSGERKPFPASDRSGEDTDQIVYQNIGFSTEAHAWVLEDGRIKVIATLEDSRIAEGDSAGPPHVETRQVSVGVILEAGVPLEVTHVEGVHEISGFVEIEANLVNSGGARLSSLNRSMGDS